MADFNQGDTVRDYFTVLDDAGSPVLGVEWSAGSTVAPDGGDFDLTISEVGSGVYKVEFLADQLGLYYYRVDSQDIDPTYSYEEEFTIGVLSLYGAAVGAGASGNTLLDLVEQVATAVGDFKRVVATTAGASDGSTFPDAKRLAALSSSALKGAALMIVSPASSDNYMQDVRVADNDEDNQILTLIPSLPAQVLVGDVGILTNLHSRGFWWDQYLSAINQAISRMQGIHSVTVDYTYPEVFSVADPTIPTPQHMTHVHTVEVFSSIDGYGTQKYVVPFSDQNNPNVSGWTYDYAAQRVVFHGYYGQVGDGWSVRLVGYGRPAPLVNPTDYTTVNAGWIVPYAASILRTGTGDQKQLATASMLFNNADMMLTAGVTIMEPNTIRIR
jgi:hypothetical protein